MPVRVFSGIAPPQALLDAMAAASLQPSSSCSKQKPQPSLPAQVGSSRPPMPPRPTGEPVPVNSGDVYDDAPPSYEDTMGDHLSPVDGPRREYHPPDASSQRTVEYGTDSKSAAPPGKALEDEPAAEGSSAPRRGHRASTESFDMLPTTPPESPSGSPPASPVRRPASMMKLPRSTVDEESPPQYEPVAGNQLDAPQAVQRQPSRNNLRPMNLGVPNRKPVPRSSNP